MATFADVSYRWSLLLQGGESAFISRAPYAMLYFGMLSGFSVQISQPDDLVTWRHCLRCARPIPALSALVGQLGQQRRCVK